MKLFVIACLLSFSVFGQTESPKHQITLGNDSFGWDGSGLSADTDEALGIKDYTIGEGNFNINYMYTLLPMFQIGGFIRNETETSEIKYKGGGKYKDETRQTIFGLRATLNFKEELKNTFYLTAQLSKQMTKNETKDTSEGTKEELDWDASVIALSFGKRFSLEGMGIQNLTYAPQVTVAYGTVGGDLEDAGVNSATQIKIDVVRFDLLF